MHKWICKESKQRKARYLIGKEGGNPLVLFTLYPEDQSLSKWDDRIKKVAKMSETLDFDGWLIINIYPVIINDLKEMDSIINKQFIYRNREEVELLFKKYNINTVWAAWGDEINNTVFLWNELKLLAKRIPKNVKWITVGKISKDGNPIYNSRSMNLTLIRPFDVKDYIKNIAKD
jgi:hypothetical protein